MRVNLKFVYVLFVFMFVSAESAFALDAGGFSDESFGVSIHTDVSTNFQTEVVSSYFDTEDAGVKNIIKFYLKTSVYEGTNLETASYSLGIRDVESQNSCYRQMIGDKTVNMNKTRKLNGNSWKYGYPNPSGGVAAGHSIAIETYRLWKNNQCYEVVLRVTDFSLNKGDKLSRYSTKKVFNRLGLIFNRTYINTVK